MNNLSVYITENRIRVGYDERTRFKELVIESPRRESPPGPFSSFLSSLRGPLKVFLYIPRISATIRTVSLPSQDPHELSRMLEFEIQGLFPYKAEEFIFDHSASPSEQPGYSDIMLFAVQKETVNQQIAFLASAGISPDEVGISTLSLFNQALLNRRKGSYLLIHTDDAFMDMIFIRDERLVMSRAVGLAGQEDGDFIKAIDLTRSMLKEKGCTAQKAVFSGEGVDCAGLAKQYQSVSGLQAEADDLIRVTRGPFVEKKQAGLRIDLLPDDLKAAKMKRQRSVTARRVAGLVLINCILLAAAVGVTILKKQRHMAVIERRLSAVSGKAEQTRQKLETAEKVSRFMASGGDFLRLLSSVYRSAPEGVNVLSFSFSTSEGSNLVDISGQARDTQAVADFAAALRGTGSVKTAEVGQVTSRSADGMEVVDFEIRSTF